MRVYSWALDRIGASRRVVPAPKGRLSRESSLRLLILVGVLAIVASVFFLRDLLDFRHAGYPAIGALSFIASAGLVIPVPGMASVCVGGPLLSPGPPLSPLFVALVAGTTGTVGELTGYALGYSGRSVVNRSRLYLRIEHWMRRRGWLVMFLLSVLPNPIFDLAGVAAGALRFPVWGFLGIIWVGTFIKFLAVAYACAYSVESIMRFFGIDLT